MKFEKKKFVFKLDTVVFRKFWIYSQFQWVNILDLIYKYIFELQIFKLKNQIFKNELLDFIQINRKVL